MAYSLDSQQKVWILSKFGFRNKSKIWDLFRRTRATNLYQDGIAIELVSTVLGHARTDTTKSYYAKPSVEQLRDAMESVPTPASDEVPMWEGNEDEMARLCGLR